MKCHQKTTASDVQRHMRKEARAKHVNQACKGTKKGTSLDVALIHFLSSLKKMDEGPGSMKARAF